MISNKNILTCRVAEGLGDVSKYPELFDQLAISTETRVGWNRQELRNLAGENMLRVMADVEKYRDLKALETKENSLPAAELVDHTCRGTTPAPAA